MVVRGSYVAFVGISTGNMITANPLPGTAMERTCYQQAIGSLAHSLTSTDAVAPQWTLSRLGVGIGLVHGGLVAAPSVCSIAVRTSGGLLAKAGKGAASRRADFLAHQGL